jgi:hypothetical protein
VVAFPKDRLMRWVQYAPVAQEHSLRLFWPLPPVEGKYREQEGTVGLVSGAVEYTHTFTRVLMYSYIHSCIAGVRSDRIRSPRQYTRYTTI